MRKNPFQTFFYQKNRGKPSQAKSYWSIEKGPRELVDKEQNWSGLEAGISQYTRCWNFNLFDLQKYSGKIEADPRQEKYISIELNWEENFLFLSSAQLLIAPKNPNSLK